MTSINNNKRHHLTALTSFDTVAVLFQKLLSEGQESQTRSGRRREPLRWTLAVQVDRWSGASSLSAARRK